jgi:hypothetical protein
VTNSPAIFFLSIAGHRQNDEQEWLLRVPHVTTIVLKQVKKENFGRFPLLHRHQMDMKASWKSFHRLRVFHWFPAEMLPALNWTPKCECE